MTTRVMLVDDAVVVRHILTDALSRVPEIEVSGLRLDGVIAMEKMPQLRPDVVVLDVEMPNMDGIETLAAIKKSFPLTRVIMFSTLTSRGASATMDALMLGADDYVTKPSNVGSVTASIEAINAELAPKIIALHGGRGLGAAPSAAPPAAPRANAATAFTAPPRPAAPKAPAAPGASPATSPSVSPGPGATPAPPPLSGSGAGARLTPTTPMPGRPATGTAAVQGARPLGAPSGRAAGRPQVIAIAVSTGGPNALATLMPMLPADLAVPIVIVQHIPPVFSKALADRLDAKCSLRVAEGEANALLQPGQAWVAPGDFHMIVRRDAAGVRIATNQDPPENSCRPAADVLFRSVAAIYGGNVLGVVLTGMGSDGLKGAETIVQAGGRVIAQDEATSVVWGMPGAVTQAGVAEKVLPLESIAAEIVARVGTARVGAIPHVRP